MDIPDIVKMAGRGLMVDRDEVIDEICEHLSVRANDPWPDELWPHANTVLTLMVGELSELKGDTVPFPSVVDQLVQWISHSNDAAEDGDRGHANDAIALLLFDDGSGRVMIRKELADLGQIEIDGHQHLFEFESVEQLTQKLARPVEDTGAE